MAEFLNQFTVDAAAEPFHIDGMNEKFRAGAGEAFEGLLRRFKQAVERSGLLGDYKRHQTFLSPGEKQRMKIKRAERKRLTRLRRVRPDTNRAR